MTIWRKKANGMNGIRVERVFCHWIYFHLRSKIFYGPLTGGAIAPMDPSLTGISEQVVYMLTTSGCQVDFASSTLCGSLWKTRFHTRKLRPTSCPSMNKSEVQSRLASGTSLLKLIAKTLRYQDAYFPAWNCQLAHRTVPSFCYDGDCSSTQFNKEYYGRRCLTPLVRIIIIIYYHKQTI